MTHSEAVVNQSFWELTAAPVAASLLQPGRHAWPFPGHPLSFPCNNHLTTASHQLVLEAQGTGPGR